MTYDLVVVGGGSGGVRAARRAAELGARVVLCEPGKMGGTCIHRGCVPKKLMALAAAFPRERDAMAAFGWETAEPRFHWSRFRETRDRELNRLEAAYRSRLESRGVTVVNAAARFLDAHTVEAGGRKLAFHHGAIAVGGRPFVPPIPHMVGPDAPEIIQLAAVALAAGSTEAHWKSTLSLHPTAAEELVRLADG